MLRLQASLLGFVTRRRSVTLFVFALIFGGLALHEVVPQYSVDHLRGRGARWQNHPSFLVGDCPYYRAALISVLKDFDLDLKNNLQPKQYPPSSNVALGVHGEWYPKHPILMSMTALPFYAVARDVGLITFNLLQLSGLIMLIWAGARRYTSTGLATAIALFYAFGTMLRASAYNFAPDVFSSLLVMGGIVAVLYERVRIGGLLLGLAVWAKWTNVVFLPLPALYLGLRREFRLGVEFCIAGALPVLGILVMNHHMFGSPFITPYDRVLIKVKGKMVIEASHRTFFNLPFWWGIWDQLTDRYMGMFIACPPSVFAPLGGLMLLRRVRSEALLILAACAVQMAVFAKYEQWRESSYGPRFLMTSVALTALLVAPVVQRVFTGHSAGRCAR
ncbi:MAG: hypothetical protein ABW321_30385 [Polyangiales bacterium]